MLEALVEARHLQGLLLGKMAMLGFESQNEALLETLTLEVVKTFEIEGENLNAEEVRSSVARRLGIQTDIEHYSGAACRRCCGRNA